MTITAVHGNLGVIATVAHELRGPMSALATASELLERDLDGLNGEQVRRMVSAMHRRVLWMNQLVDNLLCNAAADDGRLTIHPQPLDLRAAVDEIQSAVGPMLARRGQRLAVVADRALPLVAGDPHRVGQVLLNLISNAHKYADANTTIDTTLSLRAAFVRVSVSDEGPGIPPGSSDRVFRAYDRAGRTGGEGLGIGLSVVRSIVEAHGGHVGVTSRRPRGSTFWFELPVQMASVGASRDEKLLVGVVG
jgi:signal transduction histidine kinase